MSEAIKVYKELLEVVVRTKEWEQVYFFPVEDYDKLRKELKNESHIEVAPYTLVNKFDVSIRPKSVDNLTSEILKHPIGVRKKLLSILEDRKSKWFETRWFKHLWQIYEKRLSEWKI